MSTTPDHREPLDAEERELAQRLARIGPADGPPPALDAKILAAARAAAPSRAPDRRRRWLVWAGLPPALATGVGVAAAAVLALGFVWQLRPRVSVLPAAQEPGSGEEVFVAVEPARTARAPVVNPPPFATAPTASSPARRVAPKAADAPAVSSAKVAQVPPPAPAAAASAAADAAAQAPALPPPQMASSAPSVAPATAAASATDPARDEGFVADPDAAPTAPARRRASYTTAARAQAERQQRARVDESARQAAEAVVAAEQDSTTLDRIEVTGTVIERGAGSGQSVALIPVSEDSRLPAGEWLERIRARRDEGDADGARTSLRQFRRDHPRVRIPDDLRALLTAAEQ